jgi:hypothetical protein
MDDRVLRDDALNSFRCAPRSTGIRNLAPCALEVTAQDGALNRADLLELDDLTDGPRRGSQVP